MGGYDDASLLSTNARARGFTNARRPFSLVSESVSACPRRHRARRRRDHHSARRFEPRKRASPRDRCRRCDHLDRERFP